jgi:hypothetical protein
MQPFQRKGVREIRIFKPKFTGYPFNPVLAFAIFINLGKYLIPYSAREETDFTGKTMLISLPPH